MASPVEVGNPVALGGDQSNPSQFSKDTQVPATQHLPCGYYHSERREPRQAPAHNYVFQAVCAAGQSTQRQGNYGMISTSTWGRIKANNVQCECTHFKLTTRGQGSHC